MTEASVPGPNLMAVYWKGRRHEVSDYGFWRRSDRKEWEHPSRMPRGLRREWRAVRKQ